MSNVLTADFLTIPFLLELDSEAAPSCFILTTIVLAFSLVQIVFAAKSVLKGGT